MGKFKKIVRDLLHIPLGHSLSILLLLYFDLNIFIGQNIVRAPTRHPSLHTSVLSSILPHGPNITVHLN